uniref:Uncharacterized protein n=1 Tax=Knipowitschia caucasica TaxID=637954 RepID=A0AAV2KG61_KNICA
MSTGLTKCSSDTSADETRFTTCYSDRALTDRMTPWRFEGKVSLDPSGGAAVACFLFRTPSVNNQGVKLNLTLTTASH